MLSAGKQIVQNALRRFDIGVTRYSKLQTLNEALKLRQELTFLKSLPDELVVPVMRLRERSKSQILQDLFVLSETELKRGGFFVEFGAASGVDLSNTYLLEKEFGWDGILAEPGRNWHSELKRNRSCRIETECVWSKSGEKLTFTEMAEGEFSGVDPHHGRSKTRAVQYEVHTISLADLLRRHSAPRHIDYLSIDTEGSEFDILSNFEFDQFEFGVITVEHAYTSRREDIFRLLSSHGYKRKMEDVSDFDDWYVKCE